MKIGPFGSALKKNIYVDSGIKVYAQENVFNNDFSIGNYYITEEKYKELQTCELFPGDVVLSMMGTVGACAIFPKNAEKGIMNSHLLRLQFGDEITPSFAKLLIRDVPVIKEEIDRLSVGSIMTGLSSSVVKKLILPTPSVDEQKKISELFNHVDNLITLHQRECERLQIVKKSMLENMFPKNGERVPRIRFSSFTDDWEQRKLGEILQERNSRTSDFESNPLYSLTIESGVTPKTDRYERSSLVTKTEDLFKIVKPNEFVTNPMNLRFGALGYNQNAFTVSVSGYYDVFSIDDDKCSGFWNSYFKTPTAMNIFDNAATGSLIEKRRVKYSTLQQLAFYMPNDLSEKAEIGKYMDTLDRLITLHQRKKNTLEKAMKME